MSTCSVFKRPILLGTGSIANDATSITSFTAETGAVIGRKNVQVMITSSTDIGKVFNTAITVDGGSTLTIAKNNPYAT